MELFLRNQWIDRIWLFGYCPKLNIFSSFDLLLILMHMLGHRTFNHGYVAYKKCAYVDHMNCVEQKTNIFGKLIAFHIAMCNFQFHSTNKVISGVRPHLMIAIYGIISRGLGYVSLCISIDWFVSVKDSFDKNISIN